MSETSIVVISRYRMKYASLLLMLAPCVGLAD
jgi:hypothetical protein